MAGVLFLTFAVLLLLNVPIGISLGLSSIVVLFMDPTMDVTMIAQSLFTACDSFPLMAIPFFVLAGEIMGRGGISKRLIQCATAFVGRRTGGLALVAIVTCMFFAAISGSGPATVAAVGGIMLPAMREKGYADDFSTATLCSAGSIGVVIPPSIPMVQYCVSAGVSVTALFMAGFAPGILIGVVLCIWAFLHARKNGYTGEAKKFTFRERGRIFWDAKWSLLVPVIILGGIYGGIFTPTEAAAVAVGYGLLVTVFGYRELKFKDIQDCLLATGVTTAKIMVIFGTASIFGRILTLYQIPQQIADAITSLTGSKIIILLVINVLLLIVGCFMETGAAIIILTPILLPIVTAVGVDPIHFGIVMIVNLAIGFITPPLGINLFVGVGLAKISLGQLSKAIIRPMLCMIGVLLVLTYVPQVSMFLPQLFGKA